MGRKNDKKTPRVTYYTDERNDEFSTAEITPKPIDGSYRYDRERGFGKLACFFWHRIVAVPLAWVYLKLKLRHKIVGREKLKATQGQGRFVFGNHTQIIADALIPSFICRSEKPYVIVHPNNVSMPYLGRVTPYMGAIPLPDDMAATRNFVAYVKDRIEQGRTVFVYPEAHIWPYYTGIRDFPDDSFLYPVKYDTPVYCFTNTYQKRRSSSHPRVVTYVDGPFYPDPTLPPRERRKALRDEVYAAMTERSRLSNVVYIEYRRTEGEHTPKEQP